MASPNITINDVARRAGVSVVTVSHSLNNRGRVAEKTRERVLQAARDLGYVPNFAARSLRDGRTHVLGVLVHDINTPYFMEIVRGATELAEQTQRELLIHTGLVDSEGAEQRRVAALSNGLADGVLVILPRNSRPYLELLERSRVPVVLVNHHGVETSLPNVSADNVVGARQATEHLLTLGHRRIGFVTGSSTTGQSEERLQGYREALGHFGVPYRAELVRPGDFWFERGREAADELLALPEPPSAIFAANDWSARGVIALAEERGLRVPQDLSVVGFDDIPAAAVQARPALTTVRHPLADIGRTAAQLLIDLVEGREQRGVRVELPSELIVRNSTAHVPAHVSAGGTA